MNYTPEQIAEIVLKVLKEVNATPDVSKLSTQEKINLAKDPNATVEILQSLAQDENSRVRYWVSKHPNYKSKTLELTSAQYEALKTLLASSQDEILKSVSL